MSKECLFEKALKIETEALREELLWDSVEGFLNYIWTEGILKEMKVEKWDFEKFKEKVLDELRGKKWEIRDFRHYKSNEPITNVFKKCLKIIAKEEGVDLTNDIQSRILNLVRKQYSVDGELSAGLFPPVAFRERLDWNLPEDMGDLNSCFLSGNCNEGNVDWLIEEYQTYERAFLVVFYYKQGGNEGVGRCWAFKVDDNAIYATNFYSKGFDLKYEGFKFTIVRLIRKLFNLSEDVLFAVGKVAPLPIYLNGDSYIIYETSAYESSNEVLRKIENLESICLWCNSYVKMYELERFEDSILYKDRYVSGLIACEDCSAILSGLELCEECGGDFDRDDMVYIEDYGYVCQMCYSRNWTRCDECDELERIQNIIIAPDGRILCDSCARELGSWCSVCGQYYYYDSEGEKSIKQYEITYSFSTRVEDICDECAKLHVKSYQCEECGKEVRYLDSEYIRSEIYRDIVRSGLCLNCYYERRRRAFESAFEGKDHPSLFAEQVEPAEKVLREVLEM